MKQLMPRYRDHVVESRFLKKRASASATIPVHLVGFLYHVKAYEAFECYADKDRKATRNIAAAVQKRPQARRCKS
jgi:hypothetical protein